MVQIAIVAIDKKMSFEDLLYCDDMYGKEELTDDVWEYVMEAEEKGMGWFMEKYGHHLG